MEKLPHQKYRDTLAEHLKDQDKSERKEILDGAQDTEKYKEAEIKKALTQPSIKFLERYKDLKYKIAALEDKIRTLKKGIKESELDKYKEDLELLNSELGWMSEKIGGSSRFISVVDDERVKELLPNFIDKQLGYLKEVFKQVDLGIYKEIKDRLIESERRLEGEIEELEKSLPTDGEIPSDLKYILKSKKDSLIAAQRHLQYGIMPGEYYLKSLFDLHPKYEQRSVK